MEEPVPLASNITSGNSQVQQRSTATTNATATATTATNGANNNNTVEDDARSTRRNNQSLGSFYHIAQVLSSPTNLISKLIFLITFIFKIVLYPLRSLSYILFPNNAFDGVSNLNIADEAAGRFCDSFLNDFILPKYGNGNGNGAATGANVRNGTSEDDGEDDDDDDQKMLTTCPFIASGYKNTINRITTQTFIHQQSITNMTPMGMGMGMGNDNGSSDLGIVPPPPLLFIYLHSPFHASANTFLSQKLCSNRILKYLNQSTGNAGSGMDGQNLICWGGSIHTADGKSVADLLKVTSYPFLALVKVSPTFNANTTSNSNNNTDSNNSIDNSNTNSNTNTDNIINQVTKTNIEIYLRIEGHKLSNIEPRTLYTYISRSINDYNNTQNEEISKIVTRQEEKYLRMQQDREYEEALMEAQRLEQEKEDEERKVREEERRIVEEEERVVLEKERKIENARNILNLYGDEPTGSGSDDEKCVNIRLMLPTGKKMVRKFRAKETVDTVKSFLVLYFEEQAVGKIENFQLSTNYPKKVLTDGNATLDSQGLYPQAVIMVQDLDA
jgi:hypothetical protein